jgi:hypothetical protein
MPNNPFLIRGGAIQLPFEPPPNPSVPRVVILDPYAEAVTSYNITWTDLTSLETVFIVANTVTVGAGSVTIYLPQVGDGNSGYKISIQSMSVDDVIVEPAAGSAVDGDVAYSQTIKPANGIAAGVITSATYIADNTLAAQWYTLYNYFKI